MTTSAEGALKIWRGEDWLRERGAALAPVLADPVSWLEQGRQIKVDSHSRVGLAEIGGDFCYIKYYGDKSVLQGLGNRLRGGRALAAWDAGQRLFQAGLPVARPLLCLHLQHAQLLVTQGFKDARDLKSLWLGEAESTQRADWLRQCAELLGALHNHGFSHGDGKWSNLLFAGGGLRLVDLEAARGPGASASSQARDLARFVLNAEELGVARVDYDDFMSAYAGRRGIHRRLLEDGLMPALEKLRTRHRQRYGDRGDRLL
ncbi:MAG: lipopolysaccharide kinase InaA family protein [Pseudomonadota bacterium]